MAYGGHVTFDQIHVRKNHNEPGGLAQTYGGGKSFKRTREADHRASEMQMLQWAEERATNVTMRERRDAVHAWFSRSKFKNRCASSGRLRGTKSLQSCHCLRSGEPAEVCDEGQHQEIDTEMYFTYQTPAPKSHA